VAALASILTAGDLPATELHAARIDGEVVALDECFAPIDEVDGPWLRARALAVQFGDRVLVGDSALWVHGALPVAPALHHAARPRLTTVARRGRLVVHEGVPGPSDLVAIAGVHVTSAVRTAVDLARRSPPQPRLLMRLLVLERVGVDECLSWLDAAPRMPGGRVARLLLAELPGPVSLRSLDTRHRPRRRAARR